MEFESWGRYPKVKQTEIPIFWPHADLPVRPEGHSFLPHGLGRSYGDSCLNADNTLLVTRGLDRFMNFDTTSGVLRCEAGVSLEQILQLTVPHGWFLPVVPGTQFVTVGGAIANDIHGKNHHREGTLGCHVRRFELLRSEGQRLICSPQQNPEWYAASIAGLGLTGLITWAELQLMPIESAAVEEEVLRFRSLDEFFDLSAASEDRFQYTVAWIDSTANGSRMGRGLFMRANHAAADSPKVKDGRLRPLIPFDLPSATLNRLSVRLFNLVYYRKQWNERQHQVIHYRPFFFPLDALHHWNRLYGKRGLLQYQCVVPMENAAVSLRELLSLVARSGLGSFLSVLKLFGHRASPGLLSFPRPGATLALDFPNTGQRLLRLLDSLDEIVSQSGGAIYPAKDARMGRTLFHKSFPGLDRFQAFVDPAFSSSFWRRVQ